MLRPGKIIKLLVFLVMLLAIVSNNCGISFQESKPKIRYKVISTNSDDFLPTKPEKNRWEKTIQNFEQWDSKNSFPSETVLFVGSSSIRLWRRRRYFPEFPVINRGFGGCHVSDVNYFTQRIVLIIYIGIKPIVEKAFDRN